MEPWLSNKLNKAKEKLSKLEADREEMLSKCRANAEEIEELKAEIDTCWAIYRRSSNENTKRIQNRS